MPISPPPGAKVSPSTARNRNAILEALRPRLPDEGLILEIASGAGEHAIHCAAELPRLRWQPSDHDPQALASIGAWREQAALPNLLAPLELDARRPDTWPIHYADGIVNINMIHISPWSATQGLMAGAGRLLPTGGPLFLYGPYIERDVATVASNLDFDRNLRSRDPAWGVRHLEDVAALAIQHGLALVERIEMPANNLSLVFRRK